MFLHIQSVNKLHDCNGIVGEEKGADHRQPPILKHQEKTEAVQTPELPEKKIVNSNKDLLTTTIKRAREAIENLRKNQNQKNDIQRTPR